MLTCGPQVTLKLLHAHALWRQSEFRCLLAGWRGLVSLLAAVRPMMLHAYKHAAKLRTTIQYWEPIIHTRTRTLLTHVRWSLQQRSMHSLRCRAILDHTLFSCVPRLLVHPRRHAAKYGAAP